MEDAIFDFIAVSNKVDNRIANFSSCSLFSLNNGTTKVIEWPVSWSVKIYVPYSGFKNAAQSEFVRSSAGENQQR